MLCDCSVVVFQLRIGAFLYLLEHMEMMTIGKELRKFYCYTAKGLDTRLTSNSSCDCIQVLYEISCI